MSEPTAGIAFRELTPVSHLERASAAFGQRTAVVDGDFTCTYRELWDRARRFAGALAAEGVKPGDRVCVLAANSHMLLEAHYAVPLAGAVLVALNTRLSPREIGYIIDHCGARLAVVDDGLADVLDAAIAQRPAGEFRVIRGSEIEQLLADSRLLQVPVTDERGLLSINYTSGTTGKPKGVMYHHRGAWLQALAMAFHARLDTGSRYLWTLPMFHTNGWCFPWAVTAAGAIHQCLRKVTADAVWKAIDEDGVTHFCAAPTVLAMLADGAANRAGHVPRQRVRVFSGGAPPWPSLLARTSELGLDVQHLYGLTETFGPAVVCEPMPEWTKRSLQDRARLIARQGIANVVSEPVRVVDRSDADVPADGATVGEICLRGNNLMLGYYRDPQATAAASTHDGWFRTGDLGVMHPDGYVELRDRKKDVIISGGENITSVEVEDALTNHPDVVEAAVVAAPDEKWGEVPVAYVARREGSTLDEQTLINDVKSRIARFKAPRRIVFGDLPKTSTGKIQKNLLRRRAADEYKAEP